MPSPTAILFEAIRLYLLAVDPGFPIQEVRLIGSNGDVIRRHVQLDLTPPPTDPAEAPTLGRMERRVLKAVAGMETEAPTGPEIAEAMHTPYQPELRKLLSALRKKGLLGGRERDQGYPITPLGLSLLEPGDDAA